MKENKNVMTIKKFLFSQVDCITKNFINKKISHEDISILLGEDIYSYEYSGSLEDSSDILVKDDFGTLVAYRVSDMKFCSYQDNTTHIHITINIDNCDLGVLKQYELQKLNKDLIMCGMRNELVKNQMHINRDESKIRYRRRRRTYRDQY